MNNHSNQQTNQIQAQSQTLKNHSDTAPQQQNTLQSPSYTQIQRKGPSYKRDFTPLLKSRQDHKVQAVRPESAPRPVRGESPQRQVQRQSQTPSRTTDKQKSSLLLGQNSHTVPFSRPLNGNLNSQYENEQKKRAPVKATLDILQKHKLKDQYTQQNSAKSRVNQNTDQNQDRKVIVRPSTSQNIRPPSPTPGIKYQIQQNQDKQKINSYQGSNNRSVSTQNQGMRQSSPLYKKWNL